MNNPRAHDEICERGPTPHPEPLAFLPKDLPHHAFIVRVDRGMGRVVEGEGISRNTNWHGHTIATLISPDDEISVGFHPESSHQPKITEEPNSKNKVFHEIRKAWKVAKGIVCDEQHRYHDSCSIFPLTPEQHQRAIHTIEEWRENPPLYQAVAKKGHNCMTFILEIMKSAEIEVPTLWKKMAYPIAIDFLITLAAFEGTVLPHVMGSRDNIQHFSGHQTRALFSRVVPLAAPA